MRAIILILIVLTSCESSFYQDEAFSEHIDFIELELNARDVGLDRNFTIVQQHGVWESGRVGFSQGESIVIDDGVLLRYDFYQVVGLLLHEIGHNRFDQRHIKSIRNTDDQDRIMIMRQGGYVYCREDNYKDIFDHFVENL